MTTTLTETPGSGPANTPLALKLTEGLGPAPRWWHCDTHGPGNHTAWGCPECVREMRAEIARLRAALELAEPALEIGCDALRECAERYHAEMAGYRPHRHQEADNCYKRADIAWQAVVEALGPNAEVTGRPPT